MPPGDRSVIKGNLLSALVLEQKPLHFSICRAGAAQSDAEIGFFHLVIPDLLVENPQRLGVFGGDDDAPPGIAVDAVAKRRGKRVFPFGIPLPFLVKICLDMIDEGVDLFLFIGVDHQALALVYQQQVFILIYDVQLRGKQREEHVFLRGLVKKLIIDI